MVDVVVVEVVDIDGVADVIRLAAVKFIAKRNIAWPQDAGKRIVMRDGICTHKVTSASAPASKTRRMVLVLPI
jgi:hypothetical protein